jgi:uncharacterized protein YegP (UPF0339 family)
MFFEIYKSGSQYRWRLQADNNRIIADSGESYWNKKDCLAGIDLVKSTNASTPVKDQTGEGSSGRY